MKHNGILHLLGAGAFALSIGTVAACGEGVFNTGKGLEYQAYLAPRPAAVLVYATSNASSAEQEALHVGLQKAGHKVTVVADAQGLQRAIAEQQFDVVIAAFDVVDAIPDQPSATVAPASILPVVARSARNSPELRNRFDLYLLDGASLGQYLRAINKMVAKRPQ